MDFATLSIYLGKNKVTGFSTLTNNGTFGSVTLDGVTVGDSIKLELQASTVASALNYAALGGNFDISIDGGSTWMGVVSQRIQTNSTNMYDHFSNTGYVVFTATANNQPILVRVSDMQTSGAQQCAVPRVFYKKLI